MKGKHLVVLLAVAAACALLGTQLEAQNAASRTAARSEPVISDCLVSLIEHARVPAKEAGVISSISVKEGDEVQKFDRQASARIGSSQTGVVLVQIDDQLPRRQKRVAELELQRAREEAENPVQVEFARASAEVARAAYEKALDANRRSPNSVPDIEVRRLKLEWDSRVLQIRQAVHEQSLAEGTQNVKQEEVEAATDGMERRQLTSPIDGMVVAIYVQEGEWVSPGDPVLRVINLRRLRVEGYLNIENYSPEDVSGKPVTVEVALTNGRKHRVAGHITFVHPEVQAGGEYRVWAELDNDKTASGEYILRPGMIATMTVHTGR